MSARVAASARLVHEGGGIFPVDADPVVLFSRRGRGAGAARGRAGEQEQALVAAGLDVCERRSGALRSG